MIGAGVAMLACCGGPALLAGGAVSGLGAALHSPWMIAVGVVLVLLGAGWITRVIRRRPAKPDGTDSCCSLPEDALDADTGGGETGREDQRGSPRPTPRQVDEQ